VAANADVAEVKDFYPVLTDRPGGKSGPVTVATYMLLRQG
jgi:hypothetical protein